MCVWRGRGKCSLHMDEQGDEHVNGGEGLGTDCMRGNECVCVCACVCMCVCGKGEVYV